MSDAPKKRSRWFFAKIAVAPLAIYLASFVALIGLDARLMTYGQLRALRFIYAPIIWAATQFE